MVEEQLERSKRLAEEQAQFTKADEDLEWRLRRWSLRARPR